MKKQILILMMSLFALSVMAEKTMKVVTFNVPLDCSKCVAKVEKNIAFEKGVKDLSCDLAAKTVTVTYIAEKTNVENLKKGFEKIGYKDLSVAGAKCCESKSKACDNKCSKETEKKSCCSDEKSKCCDKKKECTDKKTEHEH